MTEHQLSLYYTRNFWWEPGVNLFCIHSGFVERGSSLQIFIYLKFHDFVGHLFEKGHLFNPCWCWIVERRFMSLWIYFDASLCSRRFRKKHAKRTKLRASAKNKFLLTPSMLFRSSACSLARSISPPGKGKETAATHAGYFDALSPVWIFFPSTKVDLVTNCSIDIARIRYWALLQRYIWGNLELKWLYFLIFFFWRGVGGNPSQDQ